MSMTPETPTPETDAFKRTVGTVWHDFAGKLERERNAARAEIDAMREAIREAVSHLSGFLGFHADGLSLDQVRSLSDTLAKLQHFIPDAQTSQP